jgi:hypothetical protein
MKVRSYREQTLGQSLNLPPVIPRCRVSPRASLRGEAIRNVEKLASRTVTISATNSRAASSIGNSIAHPAGHACFIAVQQMVIITVLTTAALGPALTHFQMGKPLGERGSHLLPV